jgi:ABC-2 type transport system permease protein
MALVAVMFTALGTAIGAMLKDMQGFQLIMNFIIMPIFFLSGALFPLTGLPDVMAWVVQANPLAYGVDALRAFLIGAAQFGLILDFVVLLAVGAVLLAVGSYFFTRIEV